MSIQAVTAAEQQSLGFITPRRGLGLTQKLGATLALLLVFAVGLATLLNYFSFEKNYEGMVRSRYAVLLEDLAHTVEYGLGLGLGLPAMENIPELIDGVRATDPDIVLIKVFDAQGRVLFDTDRAQVGSAVPDTWRAAAFRAGGAADWTLQESGRYLIGLKLMNSYGQVEGALALGFSSEQVNGPVDSVLTSLLKQSGITIVLFALAGIGLVMLIIRGMVKSLKRMERSLAAVLRGEAPSEHDRERPLEQEFMEFQDTVKRVLDDTRGTTP